MPLAQLPSGLKASARQRVVPGSRRQAVCRAQAATISEARKVLAARGWDRAWIDGVTERMTRKQVQPSVEQMNQVLDAVEGVGLKGAQVEHAFTLAWNMWGRQPAQIQAVADYLRSVGVEDVAKVIFHHPKLLEYDVSSDGSELQNGRRARAKVTVGRNEAGEQTLLVSYYSANASFKTAPLSPYKP